MVQYKNRGRCMDLKGFLILISSLAFLTFAASAVGLAVVMIEASSSPSARH
jgi:hypothetical protein